MTKHKVINNTLARHAPRAVADIGRNDFERVLCEKYIIRNDFVLSVSRASRCRVVAPSSMLFPA